MLVGAAVIAAVVFAGAVYVGGQPSQTSGPVAQATAAPADASTAAATDEVRTSAPGATFAPDPACLRFDQPSTYTQTAGTLPVVLPVPASASSPWSGNRDSFELRKGSCGAVGLPVFHAILTTHLNADACHWQESNVDAMTAYDLAQQLSRQTGHNTEGPIETHLGAFRATRLDFTVPNDFGTLDCDVAADGHAALVLFGDEILVPGTTKQVYVAEVDGSSLVVTVTYPTGRVNVSEIDEIIANLRVDM
jgi:hypothetical protein